MPSDDANAALSYDEPSIETILILSSFILLLNVLNWALDKWLYCGLVGQIIVGVAWGTPGLRLLPGDVEGVLVQLGYIGLILLVFEGGLSTSMPSLRANIALSAGVALTGISAPIALSFVLAPLTGASMLQCFAAGAALCSTSLGTTFTVLHACRLDATRLGVVLTSAAMLDDVAGLVMVQVISNLGSGADGSSLSAATIVRPVLVSVAFAAAAIVTCFFAVPPAQKMLHTPAMAKAKAWLYRFVAQRDAVFAVCSVVLVGLVTAASYAGTSNLFAAYIAGVVISWWDYSDVSSDASPADARDGDGTHGHHSGAAVFQHYYHPPLKWVLQPFFFASVGFSVPITRMFSGRVIWRGFVYAVLMSLGKLFCGIWLVRLPRLNVFAKQVAKSNESIALQQTRPSAAEDDRVSALAGDETVRGVDAPGPAPANAPSHSTNKEGSPPQDLSIHEGNAPSGPDPSPASTHSSPRPPNPLSLYPGAILGLAMVPRGEIGFLISAVAQSNGIFSVSGADEVDVFLIVTWAIVLCTMLGPLSVGLLVRRVKRLSSQEASSPASRDVLGVWGT